MTLIHDDHPVGESQGFERNKLWPEAWRYRDWVIEALNADLPYDEFVRLQLAGDVLRPDDPLAVIATGQLVVGPYDLVIQTEGTAAMRAAAREEELEGIVATVAQAYLGLTVHCARCHDHKFDPIPTVDYYALAGIFRSTDLCAGVRNKMGGGGLDYYDSAMLIPLGETAEKRDDPALAEKVGFHQFAAGAVSGPLDAWLTTRGIKTLAVRMDRHSASAHVLASALLGRSAVARVYYPGLPSHPGHELAARQMTGFGGMLSLELAGGAAAARAFAEGLAVFSLAESLGGVESLIGYPSEMTHASVRGTVLEVPENIVRLSVGIEDLDDLRDDVLETLDRL